MSQSRPLVTCPACRKPCVTLSGSIERYLWRDVTRSVETGIVRVQCPHCRAYHDRGSIDAENYFNELEMAPGVMRF